MAKTKPEVGNSEQFSLDIWVEINSYWANGSSVEAQMLRVENQFIRLPLLCFKEKLFQNEKGSNQSPKLGIQSRFLWY